MDKRNYSLIPQHILLEINLKEGVSKLSYSKKITKP